MRDKLIAAGEVAGTALFVGGAFFVSFGLGLCALGAVTFGLARVADR